MYFSSVNNEISGEKRALFGGALESFIPGGFVDVSEFRQVPDNQEVFVDARSNRSIIIELLDSDSVPQGMPSPYPTDRQHDYFAPHTTSAADAALSDGIDGENASQIAASRIHFCILADENQSNRHSLILHTETLPASRHMLNVNAVSTVSIGIQAASKFHHSNPSSGADSREDAEAEIRDFVWVFVCCVRLLDHATDLVISCNLPARERQVVSKSWQAFCEQARKELDAVLSGDEVRSELSVSLDQFRTCLATLNPCNIDALFE